VDRKKKHLHRILNKRKIRASTNIVERNNADFPELKDNLNIFKLKMIK